MRTHQIKPRIDYTAHEIGREDFHPGTVSIPGLIYRRATMTIRLASPEETEDSCINSCEVEESAARRKSRDYEARNYEGRDKGVSPPGKYSFYGIGCYVICQNGKPIDIVGPEKLTELYHVLP